jgi:hypothetical protein
LQNNHFPGEFFLLLKNVFPARVLELFCERFLCLISYLDGRDETPTHQTKKDAEKFKQLHKVWGKNLCSIVQEKAGRLSRVWL